MSYVIANRGGHVATVHDDGSMTYGSRYGGGITAASSPSVGYADFSNGSSSIPIAQGVASGLASSGSDYSDMIRDVFNYSERNSAFNASQAELARDWAAEQNMLAMQHSATEAQKNRDWQERLSNSSHQRAVDDLIKAGLNPVLGAMSGASTPSGATGQGFSGGGSAASADNSAGAIASIYGTMITSALQADLQAESLAFQKAQIDKQLAVDIQKSENQLLGTQISAGAQLGAAGTSAAAQRYVADTNRSVQEARNAHELTLAELQYGYNSAIEEIKQAGADRRDLTGTISSFLEGLTGENSKSLGQKIAQSLGNPSAPGIDKGYDGFRKNYNNLPR